MELNHRNFYFVNIFIFLILINQSISHSLKKNINKDFKSLSNDPELKSSVFDPTNCNLDQEFEKYKPIIYNLISLINGEFKHKTYNELEKFVDLFDHRLAGSEILENSLDYLEELLIENNLGRVYSDNVLVPAWKRGKEEARLLSPRNKEIRIMSLGDSVPTPPEGITAEVILFTSFELAVQGALEGKVRNKIVVMNQNMEHKLDGTQTAYTEIASNGALAVIYRSATDFSLHSVHTRRASVYYKPNVAQIPVAYITIEDADLLERIYKRSDLIQIHMNLQSEFTDVKSVSRNLFLDFPGSNQTDDIVVLASHTDSWDVGQGAQDAGFSIFMNINALVLMKKMNFIPNNPILMAFWTGEEYDLIGSRKYVQDWKNNGKEIGIKYAMEADFGCHLSTGLAFKGEFKTGCILHQIIKYLGEIGSEGLLYETDNFFSDLNNFISEGVESIGLDGDDGTYLWHHHTEADTMTWIDQNELDRCLLLWTSTLFVLSDWKDL